MASRDQRAARSPLSMKTQPRQRQRPHGKRRFERGPSYEVAGRGRIFTNEIVKVAGKERVLNVLPDMPDIRDRIYNPTLKPLKPELAPPDGLLIRDQGSEEFMHRICARSRHRHIEHRARP